MKKERHMLRVVKGGFEPADLLTQERLRELGYHIGDVIGAELYKIRNPKFNRYVHQFGKLVHENIEAFEHLDAHAVIKRIQIEDDLYCTHMMLNMPGVGPVEARWPESISFANMSEAEFSDLFRQLCNYVSKRYWPDLTAEQIEEMAKMVD